MMQHGGSLKSGQIVGGRYKILEYVSYGGIGEVYKARDQRDKRAIIALKILKIEHRGQRMHADRMMREVIIGAREHENPCVRSCTDFGIESDGRPWLVMPFLSGESLRELLLRDGRIATLWGLTYICQAAKGLQIEHEHSTLHRDIKPENLFLCDERDAKWLTLIDWGAGTDPVLSPPMSEEEWEPGTTAYMSPEQLKGEPLDPRSDLFSLGLVAYEVVAGRYAFRDGPHWPSRERLAELHKNAPTPLPDLLPGFPDYLWRPIEKALSLDRGDRHKSVAEFLNHMLDGIERARDQYGDYAMGFAHSGQHRRRPTADERDTDPSFHLPVAFGDTPVPAVRLVSSREKPAAERTVPPNIVPSYRRSDDTPDFVPTPEVLALAGRHHPNAQASTPIVTPALQRTLAQRSMADDSEVRPAVPRSAATHGVATSIWTEDADPTEKDLPAISTIHDGHRSRKIAERAVQSALRRRLTPVFAAAAVAAVLMLSFVSHGVTDWRDWQTQGARATAPNHITLADPLAAEEKKTSPVASATQPVDQPASAPVSSSLARGTSSKASTHRPDLQPASNEPRDGILDDPGFAVARRSGPDAAPNRSSIRAPVFTLLPDEEAVGLSQKTDGSKPQSTSPRQPTSPRSSDDPTFLFRPVFVDQTVDDSSGSPSSHPGPGSGSRSGAPGAARRTTPPKAGARQ